MNTEQENYGKPWTDLETATLLEGARAGLSAEVTAANLGRTLGGVITKLQQIVSQREQWYHLASALRDIDKYEKEIQKPKPLREAHGEPWHQYDPHTRHDK